MNNVEKEDSEANRIKQEFDDYRRSGIALSATLISLSAGQLIFLFNHFLKEPLTFDSLKSIILILYVLALVGSICGSILIQYFYFLGSKHSALSSFYGGSKIPQTRNVIENLQKDPSMDEKKKEELKFLSNGLGNEINDFFASYTKAGHWFKWQERSVIGTVSLFLIALIFTLALLFTEFNFREQGNKSKLVTRTEDSAITKKPSRESERPSKFVSIVDRTWNLVKDVRIQMALSQEKSALMEKLKDEKHSEKVLEYSMRLANLHTSEYQMGLERKLREEFELNWEDYEKEKAAARAKAIYEAYVNKEDYVRKLEDLGKLENVGYRFISIFRKFEDQYGEFERFWMEGSGLEWEMKYDEEHKK